MVKKNIITGIYLGLFMAVNVVILALTYKYQSKLISCLIFVSCVGYYLVTNHSKYSRFVFLRYKQGWVRNILLILCIFALAKVGYRGHYAVGDLILLLGVCLTIVFVNISVKSSK